MKKLYVRPCFKQVEIEASAMMAQSLEAGDDGNGGHEGNSGDEREVRRETNFSGGGSLWDEQW